MLNLLQRAAVVAHSSGSPFQLNDRFRVFHCSSKLFKLTYACNIFKKNYNLVIENVLIRVKFITVPDTRKRIFRRS